jgi:hypothetical protein
MADKKTGSARRSRDDNPSGKKKSSGIKKPSSARKAADPGDDDEAPRSKRRGDSARGSGAPVRTGPDAGKIFLYFVPGVILVLLGLGYYVATLPDAKPPQENHIDFNAEVEKARGLYLKAKNAFQAGSGQEGAAGLPQLKQAKSDLEEAQKIIQKVRDDTDELEKKAQTDKNVKLENGNNIDTSKAAGSAYAYDDLEQSINQLLVMCRKAILERE